jgi:hypothetical protein
MFVIISSMKLLVLCLCVLRSRSGRVLAARILWVLGLVVNPATIAY